ncbi:hypothetical protein QE152_g27055 [Popillia japonica]|uniref:Uncharacterized protein n=1 Tax=Popillia japonica TaxID=7064 RepID=A0AAW1JW59_POPJA
MPSGAGDDLFLNGVGRAQTVYQQASTGEKHVLFHPTSPAPSVNSEERRSWSQASSSFANAQHVSAQYPAPSVNSEERRSWSQASSSFANAQHVSAQYQFM